LPLFVLGGGINLITFLYQKREELNMAGKFRNPDFSKNDIELRFENEVVCIYGTKKGLAKLAGFCMELIEHPEEGHIHLENYGLLTQESKKGAIAIFEE
jgi:hypothetical protein